MATRRRRLDAASKLLFIGDVIADLIRIAMPALAAELDLGTVDPLPTEFVGVDRSRCIGDAAYRIRFSEDGEVPRCVIAGAEFQSGGDADMLGRVREYTDAMLADFRRRGLLRDGEHPVVLTFVIHTGSARWNAEDGLEALAGVSTESAREVAPCQPQGYIAMDLSAGAPLPAGAPDNRFLAAARLVRNRTVAGLFDQLRRERRRFAGPADRSFRAGMHAWVEEALLGAPGFGAQLPPFEELEGAKETDMTPLFKEQLDRFAEASRDEGRGEGIVTGKRELLVDMATERFGANAGRDVADALTRSPSVEMIRETSALILACETSEELANRLPR